MNGMDEEQMAPQTFIYGCVLESGKEVTFNPEDDDFEHQLDLRMACTDPATKDELQVVEVEGKDSEGQKVTAVVVSLKPSTLPCVCLGGFTISPPAVFRLKSGSGPIHISGQHLVMMESDRSFEEDFDDDDEEEEEEEDVKLSKKRPASSPAHKSQKKMKVALDADDDDDDDDDEDDEDEEEEEQETPVKAKPTPKSAQNGKNSKPTTPKQVKTPRQRGKSPKTPPTPKETLTLPEIQAKMTEVMKKGTVLPKVQAKFANYLKNSYRVSDAQAVAELWKWRQSVADMK
ncbi:nucleophosmin 1a [Syngnathus scovelli]|uniref:nucleophosmin 1a n=1 Tax=Syngnathus scovelli TaxID=161590 RepID=UPI002110567A|nr:nucleophosmin 1a [Syngnathus scovelli]